MKLATYQDGSRDGQLIVVSADLTQAHHASGIATRLQQVLDDWNFLSPQLQDLARTLELGKARHAFPFDPRLCMAPLPRAFRLVDASSPPAPDTAPTTDWPGALLAGDAMAGAHALLPDGPQTLDFGPQAVVALGDVPRGAGEDQARDAVRLVLLANHWQHRVQGALVASSMAWAPVAVTPDTLGTGWRRGRVALTLRVGVDGVAQPPGDLVAGGAPEAGVVISQLARHRAVSASTLLALPGPPRQLLEGRGPVAVEAFDAIGQSVFGAIVQARPEPESGASA